MEPKIRIVDGTNRQGTDLDIAGYPELTEFYGDRLPPFAQRVESLSIADCSTFDPELLEQMKHCAFAAPSPGLVRCSMRGAASNLLNSFCPRQAVKILAEDRGVSRDYNGIIYTDHELPAWSSCFHFSAYADLVAGLKVAFPNAQIYEYAGVYTDWVLQYSKPDRSHELAVMDRLAQNAPICAMPSLYVPDGYFDDLEEFRKRVRANLLRWSGMMKLRGTPVAINPIVQGTYKGDVYSKGKIVPPKVQAIVIAEIHRAGGIPVVWQAYKNKDECDSAASAILESVVPAVELAEREFEE